MAKSRRKSTKPRVPKGTPTMAVLRKRHAKQARNLKARQAKERKSVAKIRKTGSGKRYRTRRPYRAGRRQRR